MLSHLGFHPLLIGDMTFELFLVNIYYIKLYKYSQKSVWHLFVFSDTQPNFEIVKLTFSLLQGDETI